MIIALAGTAGSVAAASLAHDLAALRQASGKRVRLMPGIVRNSPADLRLPCDDIVIDLSDSGTAVSASALATAAVIVVLLHPAQLESDYLEALLERIKAARQVNRRADVLVAVSHGSRALSAHEAGCILVFVARIGTARLADTLVLGDDGACRLRHDGPQTAASEATLGALEVRHLYRQIFDRAPALQ